MYKDPTEFRKRFAAWKDGKKPYDGGKIKEVVITPDEEYNLFLNTLPDNQRLTPEENYTTHRYWELNNKPKNFSQAILKRMYIMEPDGWHANSVQKNPKGEYELMKPWNHPSINYEYDWYRSKDGEEFRKQYKHVPSFPNAKYVPRFKDGKLPGYKNGLDDTIDFLKQYEGFKDTTYLDGNGVPTIGYGFTDSSLVKKGKISRAEADRLLRKEVLKRESNLQKLKHWDKLNENSKTALRSYYYNYPAGFKDTTKFMKYWNAGDFLNAIREVDAGMNDKKNPGLRTRRLQEQSMLRQDPFLMRQVSPLVRLLEETPQFEPVLILIPVDRTDFSLLNASMLSRAPRKLNAWIGAQSPAYGGASIRMPSLLEYMQTLKIPVW